jgi:hypothetical protein
MGRLGHASMRAALIYQHRTMTQDRAITEALDALIEQARHEFWARFGHGAAPTINVRLPLGAVIRA